MNKQQAESLVDKWRQMGNLGNRSKAIQEVYELDVSLGLGSFETVAFILNHAAEVLGHWDPAICLSLLTVTWPFHEHLQESRDLLFDRTHELFCYAHGHEYADRAMVGLSGSL